MNKIISGSCAAALACAMYIDSYAAANDADLQEIIVTANKRAESVQNIPVPVTVQTGAQLIAQGYTGLEDYANNVPSFNVSSYGTPGQTQVSIRGISSTGSTSTIGTYIDDAAMGGSNSWVNASTTLLDMVPYDLERIEVLRGPQGTLYGEGAMGGILKYVLKTPSTTDFSGNIGGDGTTIDGASDAGYTARARVNIPVISGILGISVSGFDKVTPGYMNNLWTGARDTNKDREYGGRFAALWTPSSDVSVKFTALSQVIEADDANSAQFDGYTTVTMPGGGLLALPTHPLPESTENVAILGQFQQHLNFISTTVDWNAHLFDFVSSTSYSWQTSDSIGDATQSLGSILPQYGGAAPGIAAFFGETGVKKFDQEFRLISPQGKVLEWLWGIFYTDERGLNDQGYEAFNFNYQPVAPTPRNFYFATIPSTLQEYATFGNLKWRLTDALSVTGGLRFAREDQAFFDSVYPPGVFGLPGYTTATTSQNVTTWLGTAEYHFDKDTMAYVRAASGYRPGGLQAVSFAPSYQSDSLINYEAGIKTTFLDGKARVNVAAFHIDWKDIQLLAFTPLDVGYNVNGGKAKSQGVEIESEYSPVRGLTLGLNAAYTDAYLTSTIANASYLMTGYQLPFVPKETVGLTAEYEWALTTRWTAHVGGTYRYVAEEFLSPVESASSAISAPTVQVPSHSLADLHASVRDEHLTFSMYVHNVANNRALSGAGYPTDNNSVTGARQLNITNLAPRTIAVGADYAF